MHKERLGPRMGGGRLGESASSGRPCRGGYAKACAAGWSHQGLPSNAIIINAARGWHSPRAQSKSRRWGRQVNFTLHMQRTAAGTGAERRVGAFGARTPQGVVVFRSQISVLKVHQFVECGKIKARTCCRCLTFHRKKGWSKDGRCRGRRCRSGRTGVGILLTTAHPRKEPLLEPLLEQLFLGATGVVDGDDRSPWARLHAAAP